MTKRAAEDEPADLHQRSKAPEITELRESRFAERISPEPNSGCWLWTGQIAACGYGVLFADKVAEYAHRFSWRFHRGEPIPAGHEICHRCDTRPCVNPEHLFLGTRSDNMQDMARKGRMNFQKRGWMRGEACGKRLTEATVIEIRAAHGSAPELAAQFGTTISHIFRIKNGQAWAHLTTPLVPTCGVRPERRWHGGRRKKQCEDGAPPPAIFGARADG